MDEMDLTDLVVDYPDDPFPFIQAAPIRLQTIPASDNVRPLSHSAAIPTAEASVEGPLNKEYCDA